MSVTDTVGRSLEFHYEGERLTTVTDPLGRTTSYEYDGEGRLASVRDALGRVTSFAYPTADRLVVTLVDGERVEILWDKAGRARRIDGPGELKTDFSWSEDGSRSSMTAKNAVGTTTTIHTSHNPANSAAVRYDVVDGAGGSRGFTALDSELVFHRPDGTDAVIPLVPASSVPESNSHSNNGSGSGRIGYNAHGYPVAVALLGEQVETEWDSVGRLVSMKTAGGERQRFEYDAGDRLITHTNPSGERFTFAYDLADRLVQVTGPQGILKSIQYDAHGLPVKIQSLMGPPLLYRWDAAGRLAQQTSGPHRTTIEYDAAGRPLHYRDERGNELALEYDDSGSLTALTTPRGVRVTVKADVNGVPQHVESEGKGKVEFEPMLGGMFVRHADGRVETREHKDDGSIVFGVKFPSGRVQSEMQDAEGRPRRLVRAGLVDQVWSYDEQGNLVKQGFEGRETSFTRDANGYLIKEAARDGRSWNYERNPKGRLLRARSGADIAVELGYDAAGRIARVHGSRGPETELGYDALGRLARETTGGRSVLYSYNDDGKLAAVSAPGVGDARFRYDEYGRLVEHTLRSGDVVRSRRFAYSRFDDLIQVVHPDGREETFTYDKDSRLVAHTVNGVKSEFQFDTRGRILSRERAGVRESYKYDVDGRLIKVDGPVPLEVSYGKKNQSVTYRDAVGRLWREERNGFGELVARKDPEGGVTLYRRDERGRLAVVEDAGGRRYALYHDDAGRIVAAGPENGPRDHFEYNDTGEVRDVIKPGGRRIGAVYDDHGRLSERTLDGKSFERFEYDAFGRLIAVESLLGRHTYNYDEGGRLLEATDPFGHTIGYEYDRIGRRVAIISPKGSKTRYTFDERGDLAAVTGPDEATTKVTRDVQGRVASVVLPSGIEATLTWGDHGWLSALEYRREGSVVAQRRYSYDGLGNPIEIADQDSKLTFQYDGVGRLINVARRSGGERFSWDASGNPTRFGSRALLTYDEAWRLQSVDKKPARHDADGNLLSIEGIIELRHDPFGRVVSARQAQGEEVTYRYDFLGRLVERQSSSETLRFVYDEFQIVGVYDGKGNRVAWIEHFPELLETARILDNDGVRLVLVDHLGTPVTEVGQDGDVRQMRVSPWGDSGSNSTNNRGYVGFTGAYQDPDNGLVFLGRRAYLPDIGRFTAPDPAGLGGGVNPYAYARGNPLRYRDPTGLAAAQPEILVPLEAVPFGPTGGPFLNPLFPLEPHGYNQGVRPDELWDIYGDSVFHDLEDQANRYRGTPRGQVAQETLDLIRNDHVYPSLRPRLPGEPRTLGIVHEAAPRHASGFLEPINESMALGRSRPLTPRAFVRGLSGVMVHEITHTAQYHRMAPTSGEIRGIHEFEARLRQALIDPTVAGIHRPDDRLNEMIRRTMHATYPDIRSLNRERVSALVRAYAPHLSDRAIRREVGQAWRDFSQDLRHRRVRGGPGYRSSSALATRSRTSPLAGGSGRRLGRIPSPVGRGLRGVGRLAPGAFAGFSAYNDVQAYLDGEISGFEFATNLTSSTAALAPGIGFTASGILAIPAAHAAGSALGQGAAELVIDAINDPNNPWGPLLAHLLDVERGGTRGEDPEARFGVLDGRWNTYFGPMKLSRRGHLVKGEYVYESRVGLIEGIMVGRRVLEGMYWYPDGSGYVSCSEKYYGVRGYGRIRFTFDEGYSRFDGLWSYCKADPGSEWWGKRPAPGQ